MRRNSFTLMELLVVIAILAILSGILAPAIMKAWSKAYENEAKTEIAGLASIGTMIKLDTGYYVRLRDYDETVGTSAFVYILTDGSTATNAGGAYFADSKWDGPYTAFQTGEVDDDGTPLDPWGAAYQLEYDTSAEVMVISSDGPTTESTDDISYKFK